MHSAVEHYHREGIAVWQAQAIFESVYDHMVAELLDEWPDYDDWLPDGIRKVTTSIETRRARGLEHVAAYIAADDKPTWELPDGEPGVEVGFHLMLGDVPVVGYIDRVMLDPYGFAVPGDYKSNKKPDEGPGQLGLYALALREMFGEPSWHGAYWLGQPTSKDDPTPRGYTGLIDLRLYTREYFTSLFEQMEAGIKAGVFLPSPGSHCRVCPVNYACDTFTGLQS